jgi:hypothetical protein
MADSGKVVDEQQMSANAVCTSSAETDTSPNEFCSSSSGIDISRKELEIRPCLRMGVTDELPGVPLDRAAKSPASLLSPSLGRFKLF